MDDQLTYEDLVGLVNFYKGKADNLELQNTVLTSRNQKLQKDLAEAQHTHDEQEADVSEEATTDPAPDDAA